MHTWRITYRPFGPRSPLVEDVLADELRATGCYVLFRHALVMNQLLCTSDPGGCRHQIVSLVGARARE